MNAIPLLLRRPHVRTVRLRRPTVIVPTVVSDEQFEILETGILGDEWPPEDNQPTD